jgi:hypothetical protein
VGLAWKTVVPSGGEIGLHLLVVEDRYLLAFQEDNPWRVMVQWDQSVFSLE